MKLRKSMSKRVPSESNNMALTGWERASPRFLLAGGVIVLAPAAGKPRPSTLYPSRCIGSRWSRSHSPIILMARTGGHQDEAWQHADPPGRVDVAESFGDHAAPRRRRRRHAQAQEAEGGLEQDDLRHEQRYRDDNRRQPRWAKCSAAKSAVRERPDGPGGFDVGLFPDGQTLRRHDAEIVHPRPEVRARRRDWSTTTDPGRPRWPRSAR